MAKTHGIAGLRVLGSNSVIIMSHDWQNVSKSTGDTKQTATLEKNFFYIEVLIHRSICVLWKLGRS